MIVNKEALLGQRNVIAMCKTLGSICGSLQIADNFR